MPPDRSERLKVGVYFISGNFHLIINDIVDTSGKEKVNGGGGEKVNEREGEGWKGGEGERLEENTGMVEDKQIHGTREEISDEDTTLVLTFVLIVL